MLFIKQKLRWRTDINYVNVGVNNILQYEIILENQ